MTLTFLMFHIVELYYDKGVIRLPLDKLGFFDVTFPHILFKKDYMFQSCNTNLYK